MTYNRVAYCSACLPCKPLSNHSIRHFFSWSCDCFDKLGIEPQALIGSMVPLCSLFHCPSPTVSTGRTEKRTPDPLFPCVHVTLTPLLQRGNLAQAHNTAITIIVFIIIIIIIIILIAVTIVIILPHLLLLNSSRAPRSFPPFQ